MAGNAATPKSLSALRDVLARRTGVCRTRCTGRASHSPPFAVRSIAIFCACLAMSFGIEIVVFSPARRASRKLLERIVEFIRLAGGDAKICEYNQEACRLNTYDGKKSLIRSFPSKVGVSTVRLEPREVEGRDGEEEEATGGATTKRRPSPCE